jgi:Na+-transporting methylmalonyl-CoA/oxaloacetate decarboxylase gamma subunit
LHRSTWFVPTNPSLTVLNICVYCTYMMKAIRRKHVDKIKKANRTAERLARTSGDSYKMVIDHVVAQQERNVRFAQELFDGTAREIRHQAESNRALTQELVERAEKQRDAFQTLVGESVDAYTNLLYAPLAYYRQGLRLVESEFVGFPIAGYDELNVREIGDRLDGLTAAQIRTVREYEKRNKNRESLIEQFDRKLRAASA